MNLVRYEAARTALATAVRVDDVKDIRDKAAAMSAYAKQAQDTDLLRWANEIKVRAERRAGQLLRENPKAEGARSQLRGRGVIGGAKEEPPITVPTLTEMGISKKQSSRWQALAAIPEDDFERAVSEALDKSVAPAFDLLKKNVAQAKNAEAVDAPIAGNATCTVADLHSLVSAGKRYGAIYADPPWLYDNQATRAATGNHYNGLTVDQLCELPVRELATDDAHLHLWVTNAFLFDAPRIFAAWGFEFRSTFVWVKPQMGIGNYWRNSHEILLTAIRGDAKRFNDHSMKSWGEYDRAQHSAKPEHIRDLLQRASAGPYLELFGRRQVTGWTVWGNQIERNLFYAEAA